MLRDKHFNVITTPVHAMPEATNTLSLPILSAYESSHVPLVMRVISSYWGFDIPADTKDRVSEENDIFAALNYLESQNFVSYTYESSLPDLRKKIEQRIPPIVILPGIRDTVQHATVVSGYSLADRRIITYVPEPDTVGAIPESTFEDMWEQDNHVVIVVIPEELRKIAEQTDMRFKSSTRIYFECESLWQKGKAEEAIKKLRLALQAEGENPLILSLLGSIYSQIGSVEAAQCYESAIRLNPRFYLAYRGLGNYYLKSKEYRKAEENYTRAIDINPKRFAPIYKNRAICRTELGEFKTAKSDFARYVEYMPDAKDVEVVRSTLAQL